MVRLMKILITGATSGIGNSLAHVLAFRGHEVYACCHTLEQVLNAKNENNLTFIKLDLLNEDDFKIVDEIPFDVIICQAGAGYGGKFLDNISKLKENFDVNVFANFSLIKRYVNSCKKNNRMGKVLITSSLSAYLPIPYLGSYTSTKATLSHLARTLRYEFFIEKIPVSVKLILPGAYYTGYNQAMLNGIDNEKVYQTMHKMFSIIEKKNLRTIVNKMVLATEDNSCRFIYSAPFCQSFLTKLYKGLFF